MVQSKAPGAKCAEDGGDAGGLQKRPAATCSSVLNNTVPTTDTFRFLGTKFPGT